MFLKLQTCETMVLSSHPFLKRVYTLENVQQSMKKLVTTVYRHISREIELLGAQMVPIEDLIEN